MEEENYAGRGRKERKERETKEGREGQGKEGKKRKRRKFMVKMVPDPISPHKESWGHGDPPSSH